MHWDSLRRDSVERKAARTFLEDFSAALQRHVLQNGITANSIQEHVRAAAGDKTKGHLTQREAAFLNTCAIPVLYKLVRSKQTDPKLHSKTIRAEGHAYLTEYASGPVARPIAHPFEKVIKKDLDAIYASWRGLPGPDGKSRKPGLTQSYPDFGLLDPHRVLFEGKYFDGKSALAAQRALVRGLYETVFYLGLPPVRVDERQWSYDYGCFVAIDTSAEAHLFKAWDALPDATKEGFWTGANIHVAIIKDASR